MADFLYNLEAEQAVLGCLLLDNNQFDYVSDFLRPEHFYAGVHQRIYAQIKETIESGNKALPTTLKARFENDPDLQAEGSKYLIDLMASVVSTFGTKEYGLHVFDFYRKRELSGALCSARDSITAGEDVEQVIQTTEAALSGIQEGVGEDFLPAGSVWGETLQHIEDVRNGKIKTTSTGFNLIDEQIGGFEPGRLYILAARPGMGKTALALNMAENVCSQGDVLFFSMEMPKAELAMRLAAKQTGLGVGQQSRGKVNNDGMRSLAAVKIPENLYILDKTGLNINKIAMLCRRFKRAKNAKLIVIDYLGLIDGDSRMQKVHQIEEITKRLKSVSKELKVPIVLLSQLSRELERRDDKRPFLSDLRDSGAIEQDADVVMFIYRAEYYQGKEPPVKQAKERADAYNDRVKEWERVSVEEKGKADIIFAKNRQGVTGSVKINFNGKYQKFFE